MKNKKPKTIEDIVYSAFYDNSRLKVIRYCNEDEWPIKEVSEQIKQLIADEVIDLVTEFELDRYESNGKVFYAVSDVVSMVRKRSKEQLKKLESL